MYFWRWATWKVFEGHPTDKGVVAFISVAGFLNGPGFARMRDYLRRTADEVWVIDCSPEGHQPDVPTRIFQGVQQPVCITIVLRDGSTSTDAPAPVRFRSVTGRREDKFAALAKLDISDNGWVDCSTSWRRPSCQQAMLAGLVSHQLETYFRGVRPAFRVIATGFADRRLLSSSSVPM